ncbi:hypothetical protein U9M48_020859 [Paspalum notatum var. saurae]|uniref:Leucine-rich repeat-containing N-terminal plant-type domain-containing protein n=1 Tax=Paspalum notatum var. saurae TaxID=547442 RepID=A0AAQ3TFZ8_PASNO
MGTVLDYSNNRFSFIPENFGKCLRETSYLDLSKNRLNGHIPTSLCIASELEILDLSYNNFSGLIPFCLTQNNLRVLKLRGNRIQGELPDNIRQGCMLETVDLSNNYIAGKLPRSLSDCRELRLLDVGNNQIVDSFPSWMGPLPKLRVLVLGSNQFFGTIRSLPENARITNHFSSLQILNLASNNFSGNLPEGWFTEVRSIMATDNDVGQAIGYETKSQKVFYQDSITITFKGLDIVFTKILTTMKVIDVSNNSFDGPIPKSIGKLVALHGLNMSYNNFTEQIPSQLGNLSRLESLDLSWNHLSGEIPQELTSLTSLAWLNLSYNNLTGRIPQENQFLSFSVNSFEGNPNLCGSQVSKKCDNRGSSSTTPRADHAKSNGLWQDRHDAILLFTFVGCGFGVGFALAINVLQFFRKDGCNCRDPSSAAGAAFTSNHTLPPSVRRCLPDQESALLRLKRSFTTTNYSISAFRSWRIGTDCCRWAGVQCSGDSSGGRVTSLNLGDRGLEAGGLDPVLFHLTSLKYLNLAYNDFNRSRLPSNGFERLIHLTHLNLSTSGFSGPVPIGINKLTNLVSLDLSTSFDIIELITDGFLSYSDAQLSIWFVEENIGNLVHNLGNLRELHLGYVDLSNNESQWCNIIATSCPKLRVLSLPWCGLSGPICNSLSRLHSLAVIDLQLNHLSGLLPDFIANLSNLTVLQLRHNKLQGWISPAIFQHKKLVTIDLYQNLGISGNLPNFSYGSRLENLDVGSTNFSGTIPSSLGNIITLKKLGLAATGFFGDLPSSIGNIKSLSILEISGKEIVGPMPSWVANLTSLTTLRFDNCGMSGPLPSFIGNLTHLKELLLCDCGFSGEITSLLSNLTQLQILLLYSNNFVGTIELNFFRKLSDLIILYLSHNNLTLLDGEDNSTLTSLPTFFILGLAGCRMSKFPNFLRHQDQLSRLDLSDNEIHGAIPQWVWENLNDLDKLFIGNNKLTSVGYAPFLPLQLQILELSNNIFEGAIPIPQGSAGVLDYSNNMFSSIPYNFSYHLSDVGLFDASGNNLSGNIPLSFCSGTTIQLLDLSNNNFSGLIPSCLMENVNGMQSLNLRENGIHGEFPDNIKEGCSFEALDFSGNSIEGKLPRSLLFCKNLEILDVANNQIKDTFPCWMSAHHRLAVLVLKSNKFFGQVAQSPHEEGNACAFPSAIIIDLSSNNFSGPLPKDQWFKKLASMIFRGPLTSLVMDHGVPDSFDTYKYTTSITYKGHDTKFAQILTTLVFIDLSNNVFSDVIPKAIGELGLLHGLNISHNSLTGTIPSQLGHLRQLEALDLSSNQLSGKIPQELASLDFLTTLNLSDNKLVGSIPESAHFSTFSNSSFIGNDGLCGPPLSKECINRTLPNVVPHHSKMSKDIMLFLFAGLGFGVGFAVAIVVAWGIPIRKRF